MLKAVIRSLAIGAVLSAGVIGAFAATAEAGGLTPEKLTDQGWTCAVTPPVVIPPRIACGNPGLGRPFPGNPDPAPAYNLVTFDLAGSFLGHVQLVRADLYRDQPCVDGEPYVLRALIGYYECLRI